MIDLERDGELFILTMNDGENRWNTTFVRSYARALDEVEASSGAAALVTTSASEKFFSNGLDLDWMASRGEHRGGDRRAFGEEFMALMGRIITMPVPTVAAINGHAFGGAALKRGRELAPLGANRAAFGAQKESLFGENSALNQPHGAAHLLKHAGPLH